MTETLPIEVRQFLAESIHSIEQLEVLLLLRASPDRVWTAREVYQRVLTNEGSVQQSLEKLCRRGLCIQTGSPPAYQFAPKSEKMQSVLETLATLYKERPARIVNALYAASASEIDAFARAFRIRKDKE